MDFLKDRVTTPILQGVGCVCPTTTTPTYHTRTHTPLWPSLYKPNVNIHKVLTKEAMRHYGAPRGPIISFMHNSMVTKVGHIGIRDLLAKAQGPSYRL